jgi:PAS domain S-box-containing protein
MIQEVKQEVIISYCCHSINQLIQKYYPETLPSLAPALSPMLAHCMDIKRRHNGAKTVFIGPCISKKAEAEMYGGFADCVLTFRELSLWMEKNHIVLEEPGEAESDRGLARFFPVSGGILKTMEKPRTDYAYVAVDGIENCVAAVEDIARGKLRKCFVEMSACAGSCVGGPAMSRGKNGERGFAPISSYAAIASYAGEKDFETEAYPAETLRKRIAASGKGKVHVGEPAILEVLQKLGKTKPEQELNCGTCGYTTCRDKALAALEGKADLYMCLPYLVEKAESFSDTIIENTPNGIMALNENMEVQQINTAACKLFGISPADILGGQVERLLDPLPFLEAALEGKNTHNKHLYLPDYKIHIEETVVFDKKYRIIICIMRDISGEEQRRESKREFARKAIEITDRVIEKQMTSVQEIASLLGETTAETKIALTRLKKSVLQEGQ